MALETSSEPCTKKYKTNDDNMKIHAYVNHIVKSASEAQTRAKPTPNLTSHSFRHGGAQHANGDATLSAQWAFDRGSWNMMSMNKTFAYFDSGTREQARDIANLLFQTRICVEDLSKRLNDRVREIVTASLIQIFAEVL
ncbi:hypothetical protein PHMEG_00016327 [Phytophthora megakarya]|uniref:Uncharacterized protein n=1 Tax=Phytophthora megakarya TaxID=4795 RepID=A0A225VZK6_9STRA|nr:hypothetical protein PHMEG_00016327 [Phytophthora megakarya]